MRMEKKMKRLQVISWSGDITDVVIGLGRDTRFDVRLFPDGRVRVMKKAARTAPGSVIGRRSVPGEEFSGSSEAKDALATAVSP